ncbi:MAG: hypothetical protein HUJ59_04830 [Bacilli bacterium]|nr:hypothetical protein [Bacilli bacterium]
MSQPLHSNGTTRGLRIASKIIHTIDLILIIILTVGFAIAGPILIAYGFDPSFTESTLEEEQALGVTLFSFGITLLALAVFLLVPMIIYLAIARKEVGKEGHKQFLGLAIAGCIFGDYICMAFAIVIYIFEGRLARRAAIQ